MKKLLLILLVSTTGFSQPYYQADSSGNIIQSRPLYVSPEAPLLNVENNLLFTNYPVRPSQWLSPIDYRWGYNPGMCDPIYDRVILNLRINQYNGEQ